MTNNTNEKKDVMTQAKALDFVLKKYEKDLPDEVKEKLTALNQTLKKRNSSESKKILEKKQLDLSLRQATVDYLNTVSEPVNANTIFKNVPAFDENKFSAQKVVSIANDMVKDGIIIKTTVKGKIFYSLAVETN